MAGILQGICMHIRMNACAGWNLGEGLLAAMSTLLYSSLFLLTSGSLWNILINSNSSHVSKIKSLVSLVLFCPHIVIPVH